MTIVSSSATVHLTVTSKSGKIEVTDLISLRFSSFINTSKFSLYNMNK